MSSRWMMTTAATCTLLFLVARVLGLPDDASLYFGRGDESESSPERQAMEVFIDETVSRYMSIAENVVAEAGGTLGIGAESYVWSYGPTSDGFDIRLARYYIPLIDFDDLRRVVADGAQRYGYGHMAEPVPQDEDKRRSIILGDQDSNLLSFHHLEDDIVSVFFDSECLPALQLGGIFQRFHSPEPEELLSRVTIVDAYDANERRNPLILRQVTMGSDKKSGS